MVLFALSALAWGAAHDGPSAKIAASAQWHVDRKPRLSRDDCSGFVESILAHAGVPARGNTAAFWAEAERQGRTHHDVPAPGDLVFWDRTYDRDRNGRLDDPLTHIGVVIRLRDDGTIVVAHRGSKTGQSEVFLNLDRPDESTDEHGQRLNSWLRAPSARPAGPRLAGQLLHGFASVVPRPAPRGAPPMAVLTGRPTAPLSAPDEAVSRVVAGRRLRSAHLRGLDCGELWFLRNAVYARHGFAFRTFEAQISFAAAEWYERSTVVDRGTVSGLLTARDRANVTVVVDEETRRCK